MTDLDIELLMAYVDDELEPEQQIQVEDLISRDEEAQQLVDKFKESAQYLKQNLDNITEQVVPEHIIGMLRTPPKAEIIPLITPKQQGITHNWPSLAAAATVLLMVGVATGALIFGNQGTQSITTANIDPFQHALETLTSGKSFDLKESNSQITPIVTYQTKSGLVCREFERKNIHSTSSGLACRNQAGYWVNRIELADKNLSIPKTSQDYAPASGSDDPISAALDKLEAGTVMPIIEEQQLIDKDWH